jgi:hypothetical protein
LFIKSGCPGPRQDRIGPGQRRQPEEPTGPVGRDEQGLDPHGLSARSVRGDPDPPRQAVLSLDPGVLVVGHGERDPRALNAPVLGPECGQVLAPAVDGQQEVGVVVGVKE